MIRIISLFYSKNFLAETPKSCAHFSACSGVISRTPCSMSEIRACVVPKASARPFCVILFLSLKRFNSGPGNTSPDDSNAIGSSSRSSISSKRLSKCLLKTSDFVLETVSLKVVSRPFDSSSKRCIFSLGLFCYILCEIRENTISFSHCSRYANSTRSRS